jgi:thiol-disulfide isomerase/thioredoxin
MILFHYTAEWCTPCKKNRPVVQSFVEANPDIEYRLIDVDSDSDAAKRDGVLSVPTYIFVNNEGIDHLKPYHTHIGAITKQQLEEFSK